MAKAKNFKCPECRGKLFEEKNSNEEAISTCLKCKNDIPNYIGFRMDYMTLDDALEEWWSLKREKEEEEIEEVVKTYVSEDEYRKKDY